MKNTLAVVLGWALAAVSLCSVCGHVAADTVFVSNWDPFHQHDAIDEINADGTVSVFATDSTGLDGSLGITFDNNGNLYVANEGNDTIEEFNSSGRGTTFANLGSFTPYDVGFDKNNGDLYAACEVPNSSGSNSFAIVNLDMSGSVSVFVSTNEGPEQWGYIGVAFDNAGNLYTGLAETSIIEKFDTNSVGSVFGTFAGISSAGGMAFDSRGNLYVTTTYAIDRFDQSGNGSTFYSTNSLVDSIGLALDSSDNLYMANHDQGQIDKIDSNGVYSVFASGLYNPDYVAVLVPEPSTWAMVVLGCCAVAIRWRYLRRR